MESRAKWEIDRERERKRETETKIETKKKDRGRERERERDLFDRKKKLNKINKSARRYDIFVCYKSIWCVCRS